MKLIVLGFSGGLQAADTGNTALIVQTARSSVLVDTSGSPMRELLIHGIDPCALDAVLLTHAHVDHLYAFPSLLHNFWLAHRKKPLTVMGNEAVIGKAQDLFRLFLLDKKSDLMPIIWTSSEGRVGDIEVKMFPLFHRPLVPTDGFACKGEGKVFAFFPDSVAAEPYPESARGAGLVIHEAGGVAEEEEKLRKGGHSSGRMAATVASALGAERLVLVHLPASEEKRKAILAEARNVFPRTCIPREGQAFEV